MIIEGNINDNERIYRQFIKLVQVYKKDVIETQIKVEKTPKNNWKVMDKDGNKICIVSKNVLTDEVAKEYKLLA
jgi:hypothetical protein